MQAAGAHRIKCCIDHLLSFGIGLGLLFSLSFFLPANAEPFETTKKVFFIPDTLIDHSGQSTYSLSPYMSFLEEGKDESFVLQQLYSPVFQNRFKPLEEMESRDLSNKTVWLKLSLKNSSRASGDYLIYLPNAVGEGIAYFVNNRQIHKTFQFGNTLHPKNLSFIYAGKNVIRFQMEAGEQHTVFIKIQNDPLPKKALTFSLGNAPPVANYLQNIFIQNLVFVGIFLLMALYNLALFLAIKEKTFLFYSFFVIGIAMIISSQVSAQFLPSLISTQILVYVGICIAVVGSSVFTRDFLEIPKKDPMMHKAYKGFVIASVALLFLHVLDQSPLWKFSLLGFISLLNAILCLAVNASFIVSSIRAKKRGHPLAKYFLYANLPLCAGAIFYIGLWIGGNYGWVLLTFEVSELAYYVLNFGLTFQIIIFSLVLGYKLNHDQENQIIHRTSLVEKQRKILEEKSGQISHQNDLLSLRNRKLEELNEEKAQLMSIVAHDLKAPLNKIKGLTNIIELSGNLNEEQKKGLELINKVTSEGKKLIRDLLDISYLEHEDLKLYLQEISLKSFLLEVVNSYDVQAAQKDISIKLLPFEDTKIYSDQDMLNRILDNLVSNAVKFSESGTEIHVFVQLTDYQVSIFVRDQGPGIDREDMEKMYKKFQKLSAKPTGGESSTGLGLSITKILVERLSGQIEVRSEVGKGTDFVVTLPIRVKEGLESKSEVISS